MFHCLFYILCLWAFDLLTLFIVIYGHLLFLVLRDTNIMCFFSIIILFFCGLFPLFCESQFYNIFVNFTTFLNTQFELQIRSFQCDYEGEFDIKMFHQFCAYWGITLHFSCPDTSSQNGKSKRKIRSINNIIRTFGLMRWTQQLIFSIVSPLNFLAISLLLTYFIINLPPIHISDFFGCLCFPLLSSTRIHKLQPRSTSCVF